MDLEQELAEKQKENVRLSQVVTSLQTSKVDTGNEAEEQASELQRSVETLTSEVDSLRQRLTEAETRLEEARKGLTVARGEVVETEKRY